MSGSYLLDTNAVVDLVEGLPGPMARFETDDPAFLSIVVLGELYYGAGKSQRARYNLERFEAIAAGCTVLGCDWETAREYGRLKNEQRKKGRPIPENDLWIAATARQHGLTLVTHDGHFDEIDRLSTEVW